jgi:hypothetical protein
MTDTDNTGKPPANNTQLQPPKPKSWFQRIFIDVNPLRLIGGLLLIILVFAAASCAVIFFAAAQFQSRVAELSLNGAPMTIWRVNDFRDEFKSWSTDIRKLREGIAQDQTNLAKDKQTNLVLTADQKSEAMRLEDDARSLKERVVAASPQATTSAATRPSGPPPTISDILTQIELLLSQDDLNNDLATSLSR